MTEVITQHQVEFLYLHFFGDLKKTVSSSETGIPLTEPCRF